MDEIITEQSIHLHTTRVEKLGQGAGRGEGPVPVVSEASVLSVSMGPGSPTGLVGSHLWIWLLHQQATGEKALLLLSGQNMSTLCLAFCVVCVSLLTCLGL